MANRFQIKRSSVAGKSPLTSDLNLGELAINTYDGKLFLKKSVSGVETIVEIGSSGYSSTSDVTFNTLVGTTSLTTPLLQNSGSLSLSAIGANSIIASTNGVERLRIDSAGNAGLGVTPSAWNSNYKALQISTGGALIGATDNRISLGSNYAETPTGSRYIASDWASTYVQVLGQHRWFTAPSGTAGNPITFTQAMTLDASGNLLVGATSNPGGGFGGEKVVANTVANTALFRTTASTGAGTSLSTARTSNGIQISLHQSGTFLGSIETNGSGAVVNGQGTLLFSVNQTERARIDASGNFAVGTTNSSTARATVAVPSSGTLQAALNVSNMVDADFQVRIANSLTQVGPSTATPLVFQTGQTERARIHASGGVSIGTTSDPGAGNLLANGSLTLSNTSTNRRVNVTIDSRNVWDGSLNGYLLLAKAYVGGLQVNSEVTGRIFLSRGSTGEGRRTETIEVFSKSAYSTENFLVHWFGGRDFTAGTLHKVTYGGTVYHAIRLGQTGGGPYQGFSFDGWTTNAGLVVALDSEVSNVTSFGSIGFVSGLDGQTYEGSNRLLNAGNYNSYAPSLTGTGASGTWGINITGSATSASQIDGIEFRNGNSTNSVAPDAITDNGMGYVQSVNLFGQTDGALYSQAHSSPWVHQLYGDYRTGQLAVRGRNNGTWQAWRAVLDSSNYNSYAPTLTGGGASGTWGISITGNAATATSATTATTVSDAAITTAKIADGAVTAAKIATNTITATQLAANSVGSSEANIATSSQAISGNTGASGTISLPAAVLHVGVTVSSANLNFYGTATAPTVRWYASSTTNGSVFWSYLA